MRVAGGPAPKAPFIAQRREGAVLGHPQSEDHFLATQSYSKQFTEVAKALVGRGWRRNMQGSKIKRQRCLVAFTASNDL